MIVEFFDHDSEMLYGRASMQHAPRVGEAIWLLNPPGSNLPPRQEFIVTQVAYWVPNSHAGHKSPADSAAVYVTHYRQIRTLEEDEHTNLDGLTKPITIEGEVG